MDNRELMKKQNQLIFDKLTGKEKEDFFVAYFESEVAYALRQLRKDKGITQAELSNKSGLKQGNISKIENLEKTPTLTTIGKYLFALEFSLEEAEQFSTYFINASIFSDRKISITNSKKSTKIDEFDSSSYCLTNVTGVLVRP